MLLRILLFVILSIASAQAQTRQNVVQWAASASVGTASFTGYKIYRCNPSPCTPTVQIGTSPTNTYFDTGLANSTSYVYTWSAYGPGGETPSGQTATATTYGAPTTTNVTCSGNNSITTTLANAINGASDGDIVNITAGSCTSGAINLSGASCAITVQGQGIGVTNITATSGLFNRWHCAGAVQPTMRITGFSLSGSNAIAPIWIEADSNASWRGGFRIDHVDINYSAGQAGIYLFGPIWGLIDHISCTMVTEACILTSLGLDTEAGPGYGNPINLNNLFGGYASTLPYTPGVATYLYIEDSQFLAASGSAVGMSPIDTDRSGCRVVFRNNTVTDGFLFAHWTGDANINSCLWELYNNTFNYTIPAVDIYPGRQQGGGTAIIHDNTVTGYTFNYFLFGESRLPDQAQSSSTLLLCDGTHNWDNSAGDAAAPGWPCVMQSGRNAGPTIAQIQAGTKQGSFPVYMWNNGPQAKCSNPAAAGAACANTTTTNWYNGGDTNCGSGSSNCAAYFLSTPHTVSGGGYGQGDVDWCKTASQPTGCGTHTLIYTPYTYPHPLNH